MKSLSRSGVVLALGFLLASASFADDSATPKKKTAATAPSVTAATLAKGDVPAKGKAAKKAAPAAPAKKPARDPKTTEDWPRWVPMAATTGTLGLFTVETADTLPRKGFSFTTGVDKFSREPGSITVLEVGTGFGVGLTDWLTAYAQFDPRRHVHVDRPDQLSLDTPTNGTFQQFDNSIYRSITPGPVTRPAYVEDFPFANSNGGGAGNVVLGLKFGLFSERRGAPVSFSVRTEFNIPTKTGLNDLLDNEGQLGTFGALVGLALSKTLFNQRMVATTNWSYTYTRDPSFNLINTQTGMRETLHAGLADQMRFSAGFLMFPQHRVQLMNEYTGLIFVGDHTPNTTFGPRDPVEGVWGVRLYATPWLAVDFGYRYMLNLYYHRDRNGFVVKVGTTYFPEKPRAPDDVNVSCSADKSTLMADSGELVQASAHGTDSYNHPLNYNWTASGGQIQGAGPDVRWNSAGVAPGNYTLTAHVDDGLGNTAACSEDVKIEAKPIPPPAMTCSVDRATVLTGERVQVSANVNDQSGTPLTYSWQSNGGQIVGSGATVQLDTTGVAPGNYTVTGRVENGKGGAADCASSVAVQAPPPAPQASKLNECFFRANISRVDNVCKRILDDVALRLQNDPKARVVIVGYADPKEAHSDKLANDRATNAMKYLAQQKGVAETRIDVRSAAGQAGGDKQNRRMDVIWVPEGATY
jgi:outer membrane protein OmpA-like peptidoglycan-associated protein